LRRSSRQSFIGPGGGISANGVWEHLAATARDAFSVRGFFFGAARLEVRPSDGRNTSCELSRLPNGFSTGSFSDHEVIDRAVVRATLGTCFDIDVRHRFLPFRRAHCSARPRWKVSQNPHRAHVLQPHRVPACRTRAFRESLEKENPANEGGAKFAGNDDINFSIGRRPGLRSCRD
jgi:hypothetical protein